MPEATPPLISVIIATYNASSLLQGCLDSVASQSASLAETLVIDGGSSDGTVDIIRSNSERIAHWESAPDRGIADAWNKGLRRIRGRWVLFLGADDRLASPHVFEQFRATLEASTQALVVYGTVRLSGGPWDGTMLGEPWRWSKFRLRMTIPHQGAFHAARLFAEFGPFDQTIRMVSDYEMLLRPGRRLAPVFKNTVVCVMGGDGISIRSPALTFEESRDAQLRHRVAPRLMIRLFHWYRVVRSMLHGRRGA